MSRPRAPHTSVPASGGAAALPLWLMALLVAATFLAYRPAWHGGLLWDDAQHLTNASLQPLRGLWRIWFEIGATQQYYPLTHSAFWLEHRLWAADTLGYHLINIALHATSAVLLAVLLRRLVVPGALLAAVFFALHPMHVESVAWITELKNTLSGVLALGAAIAYVRFDDTRAPTAWRTALGLFVLALLAKSAVAPFPAVMAILIWWRRGTLDFRRDLQPLAPFFVAAVLAGLTTMWVERTLIGAAGAAFSMPLLDRVLVAGRAFWFYFATLVWPSNLIFNYPRWDVNAAVWWQWLFPIAAAALTFACWQLRDRSRAPLAAVLIYSALLFPASGFVNVYPFRFSFVADHFAYLASLPVLTMLAVALSAAVRMAARVRIATGVLLACVACVLGVLTFRQSAIYASPDALYSAVLARNPGSWLAHGNLGLLAFPDDLDGALRHLTTAVRLNPDVAESRNDLGTALQRLGRIDEAVLEYRAAIRLAPNFVRPHANLATAMLTLNRPADAAAAAREALRLQPGMIDAHGALGIALMALGDPDAAAHLQMVVDARPADAGAHDALAMALANIGRAADADEHRRLARELRR